ncbi:MAG: prepilin-type N-terminal cleavage/methylation domain-containing protein [Thermodesulfobacteriota bacterium]
MHQPPYAVDESKAGRETPRSSFTTIKAFPGWVRRERRRASIGFTLLELIVVIGIVGTLASIAVPSYWNYVEKARETVAISDIRQLERLIAAFQAANGRLPDSLEEIGMGNMKDPWGNPYEYLTIASATAKGEKGEKDGEKDAKVRKDHFMVPLNQDYDLYSKGRDGESQAPLTAKASRDDIVRANSGQYVGLAYNY